MERGALIYLALINILSAVVCISDKRSAAKGKRRVPEKALFTLSFLGGSVFMYLTMKAIHHKTLHKRFMLGIPAIMVLQLILCIVLLHRY